MTFDNLNDLFRHIEQQAQDVMRNEVADTAKECMSNAVQSDVYDVYDPVWYSRRRNNGGLSDKNNYTASEIPNGIEITNDTPLDNGGMSPRLDDIICNGFGKQPFPRDFYTATETELMEGQEFKQALKNGLKARNIDTE
ncbi:MAG: hypothetical protein J6A19_05620 [Oscillospiraceae bacterium]|nr:hypothetical protein [Oscillospiraceae bacterium]